MEQFITGIPTTLIGWIMTILFTGGSVLYFGSRVRRNDMQVLREANKDLRGTLEDNSNELLKMRGQIDLLMSKVADLEKRNKTLEDLVVVALKQYFFENPTLAKDIQKKVTG